MTQPPTQRDNWGHAARFGLFIVGVEAVPEAEWWAMAPAGVSVHAARITAPSPWVHTEDSGVVPAPDIERGLEQFAGMDLAAVVLAHSTSSVVGGPGWDEAVSGGLTARMGGVPVTTNGADCAAALRYLGVKRPFVVLPPWFNDKILQSGGAYLARQGFQDPALFRHVPEERWRRVPPEDLYKRLMHVQQRIDLLFDQISEACPKDTDGVLIMGTGFRCVAIIDALEDRLGRPVVTANQASLWRCLGLAGISKPVAGYGALLSNPHGNSQAG